MAIKLLRNNIIEQSRMKSKVHLRMIKKALFMITLPEKNLLIGLGQFSIILEIKKIN